MGYRFETPEDRARAIERAKHLQEHGRRPSGPVSPELPSTVRAEAGADDDDFDADRDLAAAASGAQRFPMPRTGRKLWVHPLSPEQVMWLNGQANRHVTRLGLKPDDPARPYAYKLLAWVYQVIACCRRGPDPASAYVFTEKHADSLFRDAYPGHECLQRIVNLCDSLGDDGGQSLSEELTDFFGATASWLQMWRLALTTSPTSLPSGLAALEAFENFAVRIALQRTLSESDLESFPPLPGPEPEPEVSAVADTAPAE